VIFLVQIANQFPDLILISEILPKPNFTLHPALFSLPGYSLYFNQDSDSSPYNMQGVGIYNTCVLTMMLILLNMHGSKLSYRLQIHYWSAAFTTVLLNPSVIVYHHFVSCLANLVAIHSC